MLTDYPWISKEMETFLLKISVKSEKPVNRNFKTRKTSILVSTYEWESDYTYILLCGQLMVSFLCKDLDFTISEHFHLILAGMFVFYLVQQVFY